MSASAKKIVPNSIVQFMHCKQCVSTLPPFHSPRSYSQLECGWTEKGFQVWCKRHECNVVSIDLKGQKVELTGAQA